MRRRNDLVAVAVIVLAACALHGPAIIRGRVLLPADVVLLMRPYGVASRERFPDFRFTQNQMLGPIFEYYSWRHQARERVRAGEVPLWNPMELSGNVLLANSQSAVLYPPNLLLYVLPLWVGINLVTLFHTLATGLLMYGFIRSLKLSPTAALTGALGWMLCGPLIVWTEFQTPTATLCWLPGVLWAWEWAASNRRWGWGCMASGVFLALSLTAGHPQFAFYVGLAAVLYMAWRSPRQAAWCVPVTVAAAFVLGAATLLPVAEASRINHRADTGGFESSVKLRLPPEYLAGLLLPNVLGNPRDYVKIVDGAPQPGNPYIGKYDFIEYCHYAGVGTLILALVGIVAAFRKPPVRFLVVLGLLALALALGTWVGAPFYYLIPGYAQFHAPARAVCLMVFALCALAAFGVGAIEDALRSTSDELSRVLRIGVITAAACGAVAVVAWPLMGLGFRDLLSDQWIAYEATGVRHAVLVAAMASALLWLAFRAASARGRTMALAGLPILCAADLLIWGAGFNPATDPAMLTGEPEVVRTLRSAWLARALSLETPELGIKSLIVPNFNAVAGYREVQGADSVHTLRYHLALSAAARHMSGLWRGFPEPNTVRLPGADHPLLDALNVRYVTTAPPAVLPADRFHRVEDAELTVWRNPRACGDAWIVNRVISVVGPTEAVERLETPSFDVHAAATVEGSMPQLDAKAVGSARLTDFSAHRATYEVQTSAPSLLVTSEPAYPGWRATVHAGTARRAPILVADGVLRAVVVPVGRSRVVMTYEPASYRVGLYLTCLGLASFAWIVAGILVLRKRSPSGGHPSGG